MKAKRLLPPPKKVQAHNLLDLQQIISGFVPSTQEGGETQLRKCLVDGFEMIKRHAEIEQAASQASDANAEEDIYGGFVPASPPSNDGKKTWLDGLIMKHMGGRREGLKVVWDISEGKFAFDPWSGKLEKVG